ncbi:NAD(P)/FAD-dependent oxidoreductase [Pinibacter aurantiacus]|uniref:NAD(P)/FAD-dependent oxidoreductase n=1 Tax=Pinibacter aurantiacus TaxID=2851599 RepID=A0A9E2SD46_9BACT|nr:NAD(P)/FAD-dependent oxidoreductase [Pinibacter aurantiacus]MBV4360491.1 NAD(P)/FAD-dependent oxidoreductase [Pinibacter aurantiacus]
MSSFDIIIIGAGPSGCIAAITAARHNYKTLLITSKQKFEPNNLLPASESIHPACHTMLTKLGLAHCIEKSFRGTYSCIQTGTNVAGFFEQKLPNGLHINRKVFDEELLAYANKCGVKILFDEVVDFTYEHNSSRISGITTSCGLRYTAFYTIDASGRKRLGGRKMKWQEKHFSPPLGVWTGTAESDCAQYKATTTHFIPNEDGWLWLAPEANGLVSWTKLSRNSKDPPFEITGLKKIQRTKFANMRWRIFRPVCTEGLILTGDAAGIIDPAAGRGILNGIISGVLALEAIPKTKTNPVREAIYLFDYDSWFLNTYMSCVKQLSKYYRDHNINLM